MADQALEDGTGFNGVFDGNAYYQITEHRVNWTSGLFYMNNGLVFSNNDTKNGAMFWQIFTLPGGKHQFRNKNTNIKQQLGICYNSDEASDSKTQPCMETASDDQSQKWSIEPWEDGQGYKITNAANGTSLNMDWHPGGEFYICE